LGPLIRGPLPPPFLLFPRLCIFAQGLYKGPRFQMWHGSGFGYGIQAAGFGTRVFACPPWARMHGSRRSRFRVSNRADLCVFASASFPVRSRTTEALEVWGQRSDLKGIAAHHLLKHIIAASHVPGTVVLFIMQHLVLQETCFGNFQSLVRAEFNNSQHHVQLARGRKVIEILPCFERSGRFIAERAPHSDRFATSS
jgi:hypothetical protein